MGADAPTIVFIPVHRAPKKAPCPKCGKLGKRKRTCTREVRTVAFKAVAYLKITYLFSAGLERRLRESGLFHRDFDP